jgi:hypothetical protein
MPQSKDEEVQAEVEVVEPTVAETTADQREVKVAESKATPKKAVSIKRYDS